MFFQLISKLILTGTGLLYPIYASYKAIKSNDLQKLEVWLMYWVVMGCVMTVESTVEWVLKWIPFYYEIKTLLLLWLTLPQIQGSTYLYIAHIHPFLVSHEKDIDAALADAKLKAKRAGLEWFNKLLVRAKETLLGTTSVLAQGQSQNEPPPNSPPSSPSSQFYALAEGVIRTYGPAAVAATSALLHPMAGREGTFGGGGGGAGGGRTRKPSDNMLRKKSSTNLAGLGVSTTSFGGGMGVGSSSGVERRTGPRERTVSTSALIATRPIPPLPELLQAPTGPSSSNRSHPRSASANYPFSSGTTGLGPSSAGSGSVSAHSSSGNLNNYGFEEIGRDEWAGEGEPLLGGGGGGVKARGGGNEGERDGRSWWWWSTKGGEEQPREAGARDRGRGKKES